MGYSIHGRRLVAGFTLVELVIVMVVTGILSAVAASRFFDNTTYQAREYADQAKAVIRYAQKLAISQNRPMYVSATANRFAVCSSAACGAGTQVRAPAGNNSGTSFSKAQCTLSGSYVASWLCEGRPSTVTLSVPAARASEAGGASSYFFFDAMGRPYNASDAAPPAGYVSTFTQALTLTFSAGGTSQVLTVEAETGYVH